MRSSCFMRLWAWRALVALAPKRSIHARFSAIAASARAICVSFWARTSAFAFSNAV
jgi:hypothetical protein